MGNATQKTVQENFDDEVEIIYSIPPKKVLTIRQSTFNKSIFTIIDYANQPNDQLIDKKQPPLFQGNYPESKKKKYYISKRIQELQHQIGGETLFGVDRGKGPIEFGQEGQHQQIIDDRPQLPRKNSKAPKRPRLRDFE